MAYQTLAELNTGDVLPETWVDQVKENFEVLRGSAVTTLPTGFDNAVVRYKPNGAGSSPTWLCVFDEALNGGAGAWAVQGAPIGAFAASATRSGTAFGDLSGGPSLVLPAGIYDILIDCHMRNTAGSAWNIVLPSAFSDNDSSSLRFQFEGANILRPASRVWFRGSVTAGTITVRGRTIGGGTAEFFSLLLAATPLELRP